MGRLEGKVAFITGAGGGIGAAVCARFIAEGAKVVAADIDADAAMAALNEADAGKNGHMVRCDVTNQDDVRAAIAGSVGRFGKLDILFNAAGGATSRDARVTEAPVEEFWRAISLDLFGTFLCCKHAIPEIIKAGGGAVVNMSSMVALMALPGRDCYTAAKGGVSAMTRSMALQYAADGVRINALAPTLTQTARVQRLLEESADLQKLVSMHLLGPVYPLDIAHAAVYLASDESRAITGQILPIDSGVTIY